MKVLAWHVNFFEYKTTERTQVAEGNGGRGRIEEGVVLLICVEKGDERKNELNEEFIEVVEELSERLGVRRFLIYPYAHLSTELANAQVAKRMLRELENALKKEGFEVHRAPFGWYKEFKASVKGHPLAEALRSL